MLGAIIGDIVGSAYEFHPTNDYNFEMFKEGSMFTDDTICTIAIADALLKSRDYGESLHDWCRRYMKPKGGFGGRFRQWVESNEPKPYGSYGNGSAMRVSPIGMWFSSDFDKLLEEAKKSAECTHNHPEGIKGAQCVADAIYWAVKDCDGLLSGKKINDFVKDLCVCKLDDYGYDPETEYENFRGKFDETCQGTVPPALDIICNSHSFEDAIRKAVSLAADADTIGAIVGSIAEHIWGIPSDIKEKAMTYLPEEMRKVVYDFYLAMENKEEYKPKNKEISRMESMMFWNLGAGNIGKILSMENGMPSKDKKSVEEAKKKTQLAEESRKRLVERERKNWMKEVDRRMITDFAEPYMQCVVAGTQFIEDQSIFYKFEVNDMLTIRHEENKYDENAVAIYFKDYKIGYVPRKQNADLAKILKTGWEKIFIAYVSDWQGHGEKRKITVEILMKRCFEQMPVDYDDSAEWWSKKMAEILDMGPRHAVLEPWELWSKAYWMFAKGHCHCYDRPMEWVGKAVNLCIEQIKDRYNCTRQKEENYIRFDRFKDDEYSHNDCFSYDRSAFESYKQAEENQIYYSFGGKTGTLAGRMTPEMIDRLKEDEIFVFGSNAQGYHGGGAARAAMNKFGAVWGQGDGLQGQSYAISTMEGLIATARNVNRFIRFAAEHQELKFYVTPIGCGIAGYNPLQIAPLFRGAVILPNVYLPKIFWEYIWMTEATGPDYFTPDNEWKKWDKN